MKGGGDDKIFTLVKGGNIALVDKSAVYLGKGGIFDLIEACPFTEGIAKTAYIGHVMNFDNI